MARMIMNTDNLQPMPQEPAQAVQPAMAQPAMQPAAPVEHRRSRSAQPAPMAAPQPMQQPVMQPQAAPQEACEFCKQTAQLKKVKVPGLAREYKLCPQCIRQHNAAAE